MKLISCQNGRILTSLKSEETFAGDEKIVPTGLRWLDRIAPGGGLEGGAIHELLAMPHHGAAFTFAFTLSRLCHFRLRQAPFGSELQGRRQSSRGNARGAIIYCDDERNFYPPAIAHSGISLDHLYLLRPEKREDRIWAITECLRCLGVAATIAKVETLSRIEARRLQLAAERGGGMGLLLRSMIRTRNGFEAPPVYAAATRWLVEPAPGERTVQRWKIKLIHGHGGRVGETVILEHCRETNRVRAVEKLADRPVETSVRKRA
jgi:protein ImuA